MLLPFTFVLKNTMLRVAIFLLAAASAIYIGSKAAIITILIYGLFTKIISKKAMLLLVVTGVVLVNLFTTSLIENTSSFISGSSERLLGFGIRYFRLVVEMKVPQNVFPFTKLIWIGLVTILC